MAIGSQVTPQIQQAPAKAAPAKLDPKKYAEEVRLRRGDIRGMESRLTFVGENPGWTRRWTNDDGDNIPRRLADGWRFVLRSEVGMSDSVGHGNDSVDDKVSIVSNIGGGPIKVFLMEIPDELVTEILDARVYSRNRAIEKSIIDGAIGVTSKDTYNPGKTPGSSFFGVTNTVKREAA